MSLKSEIFEQPAVLEQLLERQTATAREVATAIRGREIRFVMIAARGSSDNAALYAGYLWGSRNRLPVALATPSLFTLYRTPPRLDGALVVGISQSGRSPDIAGVLAEGRRQGALTLAITNDPASPLAAEADLVLDTGTGPELSIAATKTYTAQLFTVALLSAALDGNRERWKELERVPERVLKALELDESIAGAVAAYRDMTRCVVLGRGFHYATAHEWALKLEELTYVVAEPYSSADFQHGPVAIVSRGFPVLAVASGGAAFEDIAALAAGLVAERGVDLVAISDQDRLLHLARTPLRLPAGVPEWLSPIVAAVPAQQFTWHLAHAMGRDPEAPRGLSKVTKTW
jgi:glucosamine--fructose-6-phosphate aminotransferase (isomerizing)